MGNRNPLIFFRHDCQLSGVRFDFYAISNCSAPDSGRKYANRSLDPNKNVMHFECSELHRVMPQITKDISFSKGVAVRTH